MRLRWLSKETVVMIAKCYIHGRKTTGYKTQICRLCNPLFCPQKVGQQHSFALVPDLEELFLILNSQSNSLDSTESSESLSDLIQDHALFVGQ